MMIKSTTIASFLLVGLLLSTVSGSAQIYYYNDGTISNSDLRKARPYKNGTFLLQGSKKGIIWVPRHSSRGNNYLELVLESLIQGLPEIRDYTGVQVRSILGGSHGTVSVLALLMDVETRELLGIKKEQGTKINEIATDFKRQLHTRMLALAQENSSLSPVTVAMARLSEMERLGIPLRGRLEAALSPEQFRQTQEIVFQLYGGFETPFVDLDLLTFFDLSREQRTKLELVAEEANEKRNAIIMSRISGLNTAQDIQAFDTAMQEQTPLIAKKVRNVLTEEQQKRGDALMLGTDEVKKKIGLN